MNYDDWKLESPEDEDEFLEAEQMEKNNDGNA
jgi:hypothetical protein